MTFGRTKNNFATRGNSKLVQSEFSKYTVLVLHIPMVNGGQNDHRSSTITDGPSVIGRIKRLTDGEMADAFHNFVRFVHKRAKF